MQRYQVFVDDPISIPHEHRQCGDHEQRCPSPLAMIRPWRRSAHSIDGRHCSAAAVDHCARFTVDAQELSAVRHPDDRVVRAVAGCRDGTAVLLPPMPFKGTHQTAAALIGVPGVTAPTSTPFRRCTLGQTALLSTVSIT